MVYTARAQKDVKDVLQGAEHLRNVRREFEAMASHMKRAHGNMMRDDKKWQVRCAHPSMPARHSGRLASMPLPACCSPVMRHMLLTLPVSAQDRMQNQRKDMRSKLDEATKHFAREIHSDQVVSGYSPFESSLYLSVVTACFIRRRMSGRSSIGIGRWAGEPADGRCH